MTALAAALRLWRVELAPLRYDDVDVLYRARDVFQLGPTATGPLTSWGIPDPPGSVYLLLLTALTPAPALAGVVLVGLLNVLAVALTYLLAARYHGRAVAFAAGVLFAVNPWSIYFSRRSWAEIVPLFTVLALWAAYEVVVRRRDRWAVLFFAALAVQVQIRILSLIFGPAALLTVALWPRRWGVRWPAVGIVLGVALSTPYLWWVAAQWPELSARLAEGNRGVALPTQHGAVDLVLWLAAGYGLFPPTSDTAPWLAPLGVAGTVALVAAAGLLVAGLAMAAAATLRRREGWEARLLPAIWLVLPLVALVGQSSSIYLHYLVALFPAVCLVLGLPIGWLLTRGRRPLAVAGAALLIGLAGVQVATTVVLYRVMEAYEVAEPPTGSAAVRLAAATLPREASDLLGTGERYGVEPPIRYWQALADRAVAAARAAGAEQVWVLSGDTNPLTAEVPAILDFLLRPHVEPRFVPPETLVFRMLHPSVVVELPDLDPIESLERFGERAGSVPIPSRNNREALTRARITVIPERGPQGWQALAPSRLTAQLEGSVQLIGFRADQRQVRAGDDIPVTTMWWLATASPQEPTVTVRLVDAGGEPVAAGGERTPAPLPPTGAGDWVVLRRDTLAVPARLAPGLYTVEAVIADAEGRPLRRLDRPGVGVALTTVRVTAR